MLPSNWNYTIIDFSRDALQLCVYQYDRSFVLFFSERELTVCRLLSVTITFTFAICPRPSVCRLSVCNVRAPYSGVYPMFFLLAVVSSPLPSSHVVYPVFFLNSATKNITFSRVSPAWRVSPGAVCSPHPPPTDASVISRRPIIPVLYLNYLDWWWCWISCTYRLKLELLIQLSD